MISKVLAGHSFRHALRYICKDESRAAVLAAEGVRGHDYRLATEDFQRQQQYRPEKTQACFHAVLAFYPGEQLSDDTMKLIAEQYLQALGIQKTQYIVVKHTDKAHRHVHIIANMVNYDGGVISDQYIGLRGKKIAQRLTLQHGLIPAVTKKLEHTHVENLREREQHLYKIYVAVQAALKGCRSLEELSVRLKRQGIDMEFKYKGQTLEKQGVSFKLGEYSFKGSSVDRQFSIRNLEKTLALQQRQAPHYPGESSQLPEATDNTAGHVEELGKAISNMAEQWLRPEYTNPSMPYELSEEHARRKRKGLKR